MDFRGYSPRFQGENLEKNLALVERLRSVASDLGGTVAQVAIAWVLAQGSDIVPLVGRDAATASLRPWGRLISACHWPILPRSMMAIPAGAAAGARYDASHKKFA
jgi:aryl-alcohol dehydrogenase-like predicted oxidoreductase